jgi:hypothetical protein
VDNADEARKPRPPKRRPPEPPQARRERLLKSSGSHPKPPSGTYPTRRRPSGPHDRGAVEQARNPQTRRVPRRKRLDGQAAQSGSIRIPAPTLERQGPDPHLRIDGDTSGRPYCLVSAVLKEPQLLSRGKSTIIGRGEEADVRVRSNLVSREHAEISWDGESFAFADLGSTNGSFLNGYPLRDRVPLRDGDTIYVGNFEILVKVLEPGTDPEAYLEGLTRKYQKDEG